MGAWTTPADVRARVLRRWNDGSLLRALAADAPFPVIDLPLRRPKPAEIGADLDAVRSWVSALESGADHRGSPRYTVVHAAVGGRLIGRNQLPDRVQVTTYEQAWELLGVAGQVASYHRLLDLTLRDPEVHAWVCQRPVQALAASEDWERVLSAYRWLREQRGSDRYLREISAPGVDTKFVERNRPLLAQLLGVSSTSTGFIKALGLRAKPETVRLRFTAGAVTGLPLLSEATMRLDELVATELSVRSALIVENEITFLSVPVPDDGVVIWGKGFEVDRAGSLPWLREAEVLYWGDLDTHGFAILHQLRAWLPQTRSVLMDRDTLLTHRERWVREHSPTSARLELLSADEAALYADLVSDRFGEGVRLEQERIGWTWVEQRLRAT